ncbi:unnamed protein product, partial [Larinioides sclopetarius]
MFFFSYSTEDDVGHWTGARSTFSICHSLSISRDVGGWIKVEKQSQAIRTDELFDILNYSFALYVHNSSIR